MKILIAAIGHHLDRPSGSAKVAFDEAVALAREGHDVWVLAPGTPDEAEHEIREGIHLLRYFPRKVAAWNPLRGSGHQKSAQEVLARHLPSVDAVHGHVPLSFLAASEFYPRSVHRGYTVHSPARLEMKVMWGNAGLLRRLMSPVGLAMIGMMEEKCLKQAQVLTALSQFTIDCMKQEHGQALSSRIQLIPGWVDTGRFQPLADRAEGKKLLGWPTARPTLFTLRRLQPRMGLNRLIDATAAVVRSGTPMHLAIGGIGPLRAELEAQVAALGLQTDVTFMGRVSDEHLPIAYAACDGFMLPTAELECFGLIALEAISSGRPVLATPVGAIPEVVGRINSSWLAESAESDAIARLMMAFLKGKIPVRSPAELHALVTKEYSAERLLPIYIEAVFGHVRAPACNAI